MSGIARLSRTWTTQHVRILRRSVGSTSKQFTARVPPAAVAADSRASRDSAASPSAALDRAAADRILELVWPERFRLGAGIGLSVLGSGLSLAFPAMIGVMVDVTLSPEAAFVSTNGAAAGLLAIFGGQAVVLTARAQLLAIAGENISATMRTRAFGSLLRQEVAFFDRHETGELLSRLSADCAQLQKAVTSTGAQALRSGTMAVGSAGMLFALSPQLGALILAVFPAVFVLGAWQGRAMRSEQKGVQRALADAGALASRSLTSLRTLRALGVEQAQLDGYSLAIDGARAQAVTVGVRAAVFDAAVGLAANISLLGVMARGSMLVGAGELTAGALSSVVLYALWVGFASSQLAQCYADAARAAGASERLLQLMSREPQMNSSGGTRLALPAGARGLAVEFDAVRFAYATRVDSTDLGDRADDAAELSAAKGCGAAPTAAAAAAADARARADAPYATAHDGSIRALSLSIGAGERVGLVGASGCGKSTLLRLISRLYDVDGGAVRLGGVDVRALEPRQLRGGLVAVVPQEPALLAGSIRYNIALCSRFDGAEAETALAAAVEAAELGPLMRSLPDGLDTQVGEGGVTLSGGEKQRVAISRMLLADPAVVLLDEFTSALDQATEARVAAQLRPLLAGRTVIAVAHRSSALRGLDVSRVIELGSGGQIVRDLGLDEWMRSQRSPASAMDGATDDMQQRFA